MEHNPNQPAPYGPQGGYPVNPGGYPAPHPYQRPPRSWGKTWIISVLLSLIPIVGSSMAGIYVYTRKRPELYNGGEAFTAAMLYFVNLLIVAGVIGVIAVVLQAL